MAQIPGVTYKASILISGVVQGVGFRPFVVRLADRYRLSGCVRNENGQVSIEAAGSEDDLRLFISDIRMKPPAASRIESLETHFQALPADMEPFCGFTIQQSRSGGPGSVLPTPDIATCPECLSELFTPGNARFHNPFISCTHCGPRFSILRGVPYDRKNTSMAEFPLCVLCSAQYGDAADRRFHAQTVCCNACGPVLTYHGRQGFFGSDAALDAAVCALSSGAIVAVKGIGGYHFACSPCNGQAVTKLRMLKGRESKPFAVMFPALEDVRKHCAVSQAEEKLLLSPERPIVLLLRKESAIDESVFGASRFLGAFMPYTPLQHLMLRKTGPLVMTSANVTSLPIFKDDSEMLGFFECHDALDGVLTHDREIVRRLDDSVAAVTDGKTLFMRRARGYVPLPLSVPVPDEKAVLACGAQQKNTICLSAGPYIYPSTEIGDLDSHEALAVYRDTTADMQKTLGIVPELAVCDLHPLYESTRYALSTGLPVIQAQHHFAHIASVMAEHRLTGRVIGVAFDGTGYGTDGTVWGGEFLLAGPSGFERVGHLKPVRLLGSDDSVRLGWKSAACMLLAAGVSPKAGDTRACLVKAALDAGINTILSSSMGRVFDAVSSILGICHESGYEGQGAIELENAACRYTARCKAIPASFSFGLEASGGVIAADLSACLGMLYDEIEHGRDAELLAYRFHLTVSRLILVMCMKLREIHELGCVALSGGVFQNRLLLSMTVPALKQAGFTVYTNEQVPPGDGGISLGQAYIGRWAVREVRK